MSSRRTQIYLTDDQRRRIDQIAEAEGLTTAEVVRRAVDDDLDVEVALSATCGAAPGAQIPSRDDWQRG